MKVRDLGEFGLIELLTQIANEEGVGYLSRPELLIGIGDDTAAWENKSLIQLGTTDILIQGIHFRLDLISWRELGWKSLAVNISDIAAMGGMPTYALISLGLPSDTEVEQVAELYKGMAEIARRFKMAIVGGDISEAPLLIISPSVIGNVERDKLLLRSGANPGDRIAVTGYLGLSAAGLKMLKEGLKFDSEVASLLGNAHLRPMPRVVEAQILVQQGIKTAIDISDGLVSDLTHICKLSNVGAKVWLKEIPLHPLTKAVFKEEALNLALSGGEDYELLFTGREESIKKAKESISLPVTIIGEITQDKPGKVILLDEHGKEVKWEEGGWEHFKAH